MQPESPGFGGIRQLGYVVDDLESAMAAWRRLGVGPWTVIRNVSLNSVYLGAASRPLIDIALSYRGEIQIELIQQRNEAPSPYRSMIEERRYGLHHIAFLSEHIDDDVRRAESRGMKMVWDIRMTMSGRYVYLQSPALGEHIHIEFLEATPMLKLMFWMGMRKAASWDGTGEPLALDLAGLPSSLARAALSLVCRSGKTSVPAPPNFGRIRRLGYVVEDLDQAVATWSDQLGVGPWTIIRDVTPDCALGGVPGAPLVDIALAYCGAVRVELIQQRNAAPSPYRALIDQRRFGVHHIAFQRDDIDADVALAEALGLKPVSNIRMPLGERCAYLQSPVLGEHVYIGLLEARSAMGQV